MRVTKPIDATVDMTESAKQTAVALIGVTNTKNVMDLFFSDNLREVENGIRQLNEFSSKSYLLSAILLHSIVYSKTLYEQSGLDWPEYAKQSRERLGLDPRDVSQYLSAARFFIKYHETLARKGFNPNGSILKLARAELAVELCGSVDEVIEHIISDSWWDFKTWYQSFKPSKALPQPTEYKRDDIGFKGNKFTIGGIEAVKISDEINDGDRLRLQGYMKTIFEAIARGYEPAIIPVYDKKEAASLERLRDKNRAKK